jgi:hypothetical protein
VLRKLIAPIALLAGLLVPVTVAGPADAAVTSVTKTGSWCSTQSSRYCITSSFTWYRQADGSKRLVVIRTTWKLDGAQYNWGSSTVQDDYVGSTRVASIGPFDPAASFSWYPDTLYKFGTNCGAVTTTGYPGGSLRSILDKRLCL